MKTEIINIEEIKPYKKNQKKHPKEQIEKLKKSISKYGFNTPVIIDKDNVIIAGHGRLIAAKELNLKEISCVRKTDLTEEQVKAYRIMDNKSAESDWDLDLLQEELISLKELDFDLELTGFDEIETKELLEEEKEIEEDDFDTESAYNKAKESTKVKQGDIYQLGNHRLMCGNSAQEKYVNKLMNNKKADMCFTDPPYNIDYKDMKGKHEEMKYDNISMDNFNQFLNAFMSQIKTEKGYICCNWKSYTKFYDAMSVAGIDCKSCIVWDKEIRVQNLDKYFKQHEFILYFGKLGGEKTLRGDVYRLKRQRGVLHPTMKPIELCADFIQDSSEQNEIVLDLFGGSGSTLIACEQLNRKCYMMELDIVYVQVIIDRWEKYTNRKVNKIR